MVKKSIKIELSSGLEARPAAMLVQVASRRGDGQHGPCHHRDRTPPRHPDGLQR